MTRLASSPRDLPDSDSSLDQARTVPHGERGALGAPSRCTAGACYRAGVALTLGIIAALATTACGPGPERGEGQMPATDTGAPGDPGVRRRGAAADASTDETRAVAASEMPIAFPKGPPKAAVPVASAEDSEGTSPADMPMASPEDPPAAATTDRLACDLDQKAPDGSELTLPVFDVSIDDEAWQALHEDVQADVEVDVWVCADGHSYPIELEIQGASGREFEKRSFKLKFNRGRRLSATAFGDGDREDGLRKVIFKAMYKDQSLIREGISFDLLSLMGQTVPRVSYANLRFNGEYWGVYALVEPVDHEFLRRNNYPPGGRLYKAVRKAKGRADFSPEQELKRAFEDHSESPSDDWSDLESLVDALQNTPMTEEAMLEEVDPIFPLQYYYDRMIWVAYTQNTDAVAQNFFLYNAPDEGRASWHILPWDSDISLSNHWRLDVAMAPADADPLLDGDNYFSRRLMKIGALRQAYVSRFETTMANVLSREAVEQVRDKHMEWVRSDLPHDHARWQRDSSREEEFGEIEAFLENRPQLLADWLADFWDSP